MSDLSNKKRKSTKSKSNSCTYPLSLKPLTAVTMIEAPIKATSVIPSLLNSNLQIICLSPFFSVAAFNSCTSSGSDIKKRQIKVCVSSFHRSYNIRQSSRTVSNQARAVLITALPHCSSTVTFSNSPSFLGIFFILRSNAGLTKNTSISSSSKLSTCFLS